MTYLENFPQQYAPKDAVGNASTGHFKDYYAMHPQGLLEN